MMQRRCCLAICFQTKLNFACDIGQILFFHYTLLTTYQLAVHTSDYESTTEHPSPSTNRHLDLFVFRVSCSSPPMCWVFRLHFYIAPNSDVSILINGRWGEGCQFHLWRAAINWWATLGTSLSMRMASASPFYSGCPILPCQANLFCLQLPVWMTFTNHGLAFTGIYFLLSLGTRIESQFS